MALASTGPSPERPGELDVEVVRDNAGADAFRDLTATGFELPTDFSTRFISEAALADLGVVAVLGTVAGEPISIALLSVTGTTAGIYNVATPPEHRRRGYGAAVTWAALQEGTKLGCDHAIIQASQLGAAVYRNMGFVDIGRYVQLEGPPSHA